MKFADLLGKDSRELCQMCSDLKREFMNMRILSRTKQDIKTSAIRECRKNIARVKTRLTQLKEKKKQ
ncbi:MAG: 50S ribosomal protein L29 [Holosporales bacterium]|jgi:ribosomal protein L29|nr:50S ribosomal protein L29 [Holosporales bacterium]